MKYELLSESYLRYPHRCSSAKVPSLDAQPRTEPWDLPINVVTTQLCHSSINLRKKPLLSYPTLLKKLLHVCVRVITLKFH